jgi:hypothetical protein
VRLERRARGRRGLAVVRPDGRGPWNLSPPATCARPPPTSSPTCAPPTASQARGIAAAPGPARRPGRGDQRPPAPGGGACGLRPRRREVRSAMTAPCPPT